MKTDILIVGSGCSGLYAVLNLPDELDIMLITKSDFESSDSFLAQGGMCTLKDPSDYDSFFEDTLKAGHYENDQKSVEIMIKSVSLLPGTKMVILSIQEKVHMLITEYFSMKISLEKRSQATF